MSKPDFNLLITLDVLLAEGSVARAAQRLGLSSSAMSRALARLRHTTGDPLLVRAGRGLVATPRALALQESVRRLVQEAESVLRPTETLDLKNLKRTFSLRSSEGFAENFGAKLIARVSNEAPGVRLYFVQKPNKSSIALREGSVDIETGVIDAETSPELITQTLFHDRFVGVIRVGHPLCNVKMSLARYATSGHICVSRSGLGQGPIENALKTVNTERNIVTIVAGFSTALALTRASDLIASVPERHTGNLRNGMHSFTLPFFVPEFSLSLLWHPRMDADPAHRWLRSCIREVCSQVAIENKLNKNRRRHRT